MPPAVGGRARSRAPPGRGDGWRSSAARAHERRESERGRNPRPPERRSRARRHHLIFADWMREVEVNQPGAAKDAKQTPVSGWTSELDEMHTDTGRPDPGAPAIQGGVGTANQLDGVAQLSTQETDQPIEVH